jgi:hypothetical protein
MLIMSGEWLLDLTGVIIAILTSSGLSYWIAKRTAKAQYAHELELQNLRYKQESELELRKHEMDLKNETKSRRDELFINKGIEKVSALIDAIHLTFEMLKFEFSLKKRELAYDAELGANKQKFTVVSYTDIRTFIQYVNPDIKDSELEKRNIDNHLNLYDEWKNAVSKQKQIYRTKLEKIESLRSGWMLYIYDKKLVKKIQEFEDIIGVMGLIDLAIGDEITFFRRLGEHEKTLKALINEYAEYIRNPELALEK